MAIKKNPKLIVSTSVSDAVAKIAEDARQKRKDEHLEKIVPKKAFDAKKIKKYTDDELLAYLGAERAKKGISMTAPQIIVELKERGVKVPPKKRVSKQKISEILEEAVEPTSEEELLQESREEFTTRAIEFIESKLVDNNNKPLFNFRMVKREDQDKPENQVHGKWDEETNTIWINPKYVKRETAFHEIFHPLIRALLSNTTTTKYMMDTGEVTESKLGSPRKMIIDIYKDLIKTKEGKRIYTLVSNKYVAVGDFAEGSDAFIEEVLAFAFGKAARDSKIALDYKHNSKGFVKVLKKFWDFLKRLFSIDAPHIYYDNTLDFVKDGMTFGQLVDFILDKNTHLVIEDLNPAKTDAAYNYEELLEKGLVLDSKELRNLSKELFGVEYPQVTIEVGNIEEDFPVYNILTKRILPSYFDILKNEVEKNKGFYDKKTNDIVLKKLFKQFGISLSMYGSKKIASNLVEWEKMLEQSLTGEDLMLLPVLTESITNIQHMMQLAPFDKVQQTGYVPGTGELNSFKYLLSEVSLRYKGQELIESLLVHERYGETGMVSLKEFKQMVNRKVHPLPKREKEILVEFVNTKYKGISPKTKLNINDILRDYKELVQKDYAINRAPGENKEINTGHYSAFHLLSNKEKQHFMDSR